MCESEQGQSELQLLNISLPNQCAAPLAPYPDCNDAAPDELPVLPKSFEERPARLNRRRTHNAVKPEINAWPRCVETGHLNSPAD